MQVSFKSLWPVLSHTFSAWNEHNAQELGAALAFYTILSLAPLLILILRVVSMAFGASSAEGQVLSEVQQMIGPQGAGAVKEILEHQHQPVAGTLASIVAVLMTIFAASGVFSELQSAMNRVWEVKYPKTGRLWELVKERFYAFGMVFAIGIFLVVSLACSAGVATMGKFFSQFLPMPEALLGVLDFVVSLAGITFAFGLIFKYVPETRIDWEDVWIGAIATAFLFTVGKLLIGLYLGKATVGSAYGAAGSLVAIVVWVYYSSMIFLFGAEFTHILAGLQRGGSPVSLRRQT